MHRAVLRPAHRSGCSVAVLGAGPIGALAAQICAETLAAEVMVAVKQENLDLIREAVACTTVDPSTESIAEAAPTRSTR